MSDIRDAGPRMRQMNDVLEENERLRGRLAWTERERDSLRRSIKNLAAYVAELNAEIESLRASPRPQPYAKSDEKRGDSHTDRGATPPRNGALSGCETVPDPDSRVWETPPTPQTHATPPQGSVQGEGSVPRSRTENEPVAWANFYPDEENVDFDRDHVEQWSDEGEVVPLYRRPQPTLTDGERAAVEEMLHLIATRQTDYQREAHTLRKLLERLA